MRTKRITAFLFAVILAFESIAVGAVPAQAQAVSENTVETGVETEIDCESQGTDNVAVVVEEITEVPAEKATIVRSGKNGTLDWSIDSDGHLTISGNGDYALTSSSSTNSWLTYSDEIKTATVNVTGITNTSQMFAGCSNLTSLDVTGLDTSSVTDMKLMFSNCKSLTSLDLSGFDTSSVTDMDAMFFVCDNLISLDLSGFDTSSVTDMGVMFAGCRSLRSLDLSGFDTSNITTMSGMFFSCYNLALLIAPENKSAVDMGLPDIDYDWKYQPTGETVTKVTKAGIYMRNIGETDGNLSWGLDTNGHLTVTGNGDYAARSDDSTESGWLAYKAAIKSATINVTGIKDTSYMFSGCSNLTSLDLSGLDTSNVTDMSAMFAGCDNLSQLIASENQSAIDMCLPVSPEYVWKYQPTGETVTKVTKAGTYIREDKPDESVVETPPTSGEDKNVDTSEPSAKKERKVETKVEIKPDGSVTKTETITEPNGEVVIKIISTSKDQKKETIVIMKFNASGQLIDVAIEVVHVVKSSKMTINLKELKALVDQVLLGNTAYIYPLGSDSLGSEKVDSLGAFRQSVQDSLGAAQEKPNVTIKLSAKNSSGQKKYSVAIQKKDLTKKKFVVFASDKNDNAVMINTKKNIAKVNKKKDLTIKIAKKGNYQLQNTKDAKKTNKKIIKTVKPMKKSITIKKGKKAPFELSAKCNKDNIQKITYSSNSSKVKVNKKGKMQAKAKGTEKVTATVTMKNGKKKKIKMKVKVS